MLARHLFFDQPLQDAINAPRIHHQLTPMQLEYEDGFDEAIVNGLADIGHNMSKAIRTNGFAALTAIGRRGNQLTACFDPRRPGSIYID